MREPTLVEMTPPSVPPGSWLSRTARALFVERRLPTRVSILLDKGLSRLGWRVKVISIGSVSMCVRRLTADEHYVHEVITQRSYFPRGYEIQATDTVVDVGSNVGSFAVSAAQIAATGRVIAIEPVAENFQLLQRNITINNLANVTPIRAAILGSNGTASIHISQLGTGHHSVLPHAAGKSHEQQSVPALTLERLLSDHGIDRVQFLKMDCEGAEFEILEQMPTILWSRIDKIAMEYHASSVATKREEAGRLVKLLDTANFVIDHYTDHVGTPRGMIFARLRS